jgi:hypothetical protein
MIYLNRYSLTLYRRKFVDDWCTSVVDGIALHTRNHYGTSYNSRLLKMHIDEMTDLHYFYPRFFLSFNCSVPFLSDVDYNSHSTHLAERTLSIGAVTWNNCSSICDSTDRSHFVVHQRWPRFSVHLSTSMYISYAIRTDTGNARSVNRSNAKCSIVGYSSIRRIVCD